MGELVTLAAGEEARCDHCKHELLAGDEAIEVGGPRGQIYCSTRCRLDARTIH